MYMDINMYKIKNVQCVIFFVKHNNKVISKQRLLIYIFKAESNENNYVSMHIMIGIKK